MLHEAAHALATRRGIKDTSAAGNRYHNKRFAALAAELGLRGPNTPDKITGWSNCTPHRSGRYCRLRQRRRSDQHGPAPFLVDLTTPAGPGGGGEEEDQGDDGPGKPAKRGGRRAALECACQPEPQRIQLTPKQIEDGPIMSVCGLCGVPFEPPGDG